MVLLCRRGVLPGWFTLLLNVCAIIFISFMVQSGGKRWPTGVI